MIKQDEKFWKEIRCTECRTLLGLEYIFSGRLMIKCRKCGEKNTINYKTPKKLYNKINKEEEMILYRDKEKGGEK